MTSHNPAIRYPSIILFLAMLYVTIDLLSNILVFKIVKIGFFLQPGGIFIYPCLFLIGDVIAEVYGYKLAKTVLIFDLLCNFIFAFLATALIKLPSPLDWGHQDAYNFILGSLINVNTSIAIAVLVGGLINTYLISRWKALLQGKYFWLRSIGSTAIGSAIMLVMAAILIFRNTLTTHQIIVLILSDYTFRIIYSIIGVLPASILVNIIKVYEGELNSFSRLKTFNPFNYKKAP